jgi:hypothetical protein
MNLSGTEKNQVETLNVVALFGRAKELEFELDDDPLADLLAEAGAAEDDEAEVELSGAGTAFTAAPRRVVSEQTATDAALYILEDQLSQVRSRLSRIRFYLAEINDLI